MIIRKNAISWSISFTKSINIKLVNEDKWLLNYL